MSFFKIISPTLLILSYIFLYPVHFLSADESSKDGIICKNRPADYFLSRALRDQSRAKQFLYNQDKKTALALYQDSIRNFERYMKCVPDEKISSLTHLNLARSYLELGEYKKAEGQVELSLTRDGLNRLAIILKTKLLIRQGKLNDAETFLESKISSFSEDSDFLFLLGSLNKELGRLNKSILYFTSLYDSIMTRDGNPKYKIHALKNLADIHYQKMSPKKALFYYQAYLVLNPNDTDARFQVAQIFNILGDFGTSKKILMEIHKENPSNKEVELLLAEMHFVESRQTSFPYIQKLVEDGKVPRIHLVYALYSVLKRNWIFADGFLREYVPKHEKRLAARLAWVDVLRARYKPVDLSQELKTVSEMTYNMKQFQLSYNLAKERLEIQKLLEEDKEKIAYTYWFLSNCMEQLNSPNRAILYSKRAIAISPKSQDREKYQLHLGHILLGNEINRTEEALDIANQVLVDNPNNGSAWYLKGYSLFQKNELKSSVASLDQAIKLESDNSGYYFFRGIVFEKLGNVPGLERDMNQSIELTPTNPVPFNYLGFYYAEKGIKIDKALELIQKAVDLEPDNGAYQDSLGWVYFRKGEIENALFHLYLAKQMLDDKGIQDPTVYDHLGDVYNAKEEYPIARDYWRKALQFTKDIEKKRIIQEKIKKNNLPRSHS